MASAADAGPTGESAASRPAPMTTTQRFTLVATGLGLFMIFLDALIVNVALPDIQASFGVGEAGLQWVVAAYSLGMAMFIMSAATVADMHGRRRVYLLSVVVFTLASVACGLAPSIGVLNVARGIQGIAAAAANVTSLALVSAAFPEAKAKARAIGIWTAIASVATAVGPTVGGILTQRIGWRAIFMVNVPVGLAAVILTIRYVAESRDETERGFDPVGQLLFIVSIGALAYAVIEGPQSGWGSPAILGLFAVAAAGLTCFVLYEKASRDPMMDVTLFADRVYSVAIGTIFVQFFAIYGMLLVVTQYFQNVKGLSPSVAGFLILPFSAGVTIMSPVAGRLVGRLGSRAPILVGVASIFTGLVVIIAAMGLGPIGVAIGLGVVGIGAALTLTPITSLAMSSVPANRAGMASGIMSAQRAIGSTVGFAVLGSILAAWLGATLSGDLATTVPDSSQRQAVTSAIIDDADPHAYAAEIGPGRPITSADAATQAAILAAADDDFVQGIRLALGVAATLVAISWVAGAVWLPHGPAALVAEEAEAGALEDEEAERRDE